MKIALKSGEIKSQDSRLTTINLEPITITQSTPLTIQTTINIHRQETRFKLLSSSLVQSNEYRIKSFSFKSNNQFIIIIEAHHITTKTTITCVILNALLNFIVIVAVVNQIFATGGCSESTILSYSKLRCKSQIRRSSCLSLTAYNNPIILQFIRFHLILIEHNPPCSYSFIILNIYLLD